MVSTSATPTIVVDWKPVTCSYRPSRRGNHDDAWETVFWRASVAGTLFQVGNIPYSIMDFSQDHRRRAPDQHPDSCWQIWFAEDEFDWPEYMAVLRGATEAPHALAIAQSHIEAYFAQKRDSLVQQLLHDRHRPPEPRTDTFHSPVQLRVADLEQRIARIDQETRVGQARLFF